MMTIRLLFFTSVVFLCNAAAAQEDELSEIISKPEISVALDIGGITAIPLFTLQSDNEKSQYRVMGKFQYVIDDTFAFDLAIGKDHRASGFVRNNFSNYTHNSGYAQLVFNVIPIERNWIRTFLGFGISVGKIKESGIVEIGDDYFDPFVGEFEMNQFFRGWITSLKLEFEMDPRWSIVVDARMQSMYINSADRTQVIHSVPGDGESLLHSQVSGLSLNSALLLKYRLFGGY